MGEVVAVSLSFPTVLFTICLGIVVLYWAIVLLGLTEMDILDSDGGESAVAGALLPTTRAGRDIPVTIVLSLWILLSWCSCAALSIVADDVDLLTALGGLRHVLVLVLGPVLAWVLTLVLVLPLGRLYRTDDAASHSDFVGRTCVIRTTGVSADFGQAEITSADGSSAIVQVRLGEGLGGPERPLARGESALIFDYDTEGGHFYVTPLEPGLGPPTGTT